MNILQVIQFLSPKFGGSVAVPVQLSKELAKKNHNVTIVTSDYGFDTKYAQEIKESGVKVIPFRAIINLGQFIYSPALKSWSREHVKNYDIIHLHNFRSYQNNVISDCAITYNIPYILQAHGSVLPFHEKQGLKRLYDLVWGKKILSFSSNVFALTETEAEQYQTMGVSKNKIKIVPNGLDLSEFLNTPPYGKFRCKYNISEKEKIILYLGRIHETKGLDLLIDSFYEITRTRNNVQLIMIGPDDGYLLHVLKKIHELDLENKIRILGFIEQEEKIEALVDADVFVTPSFYGFPVTFLEAMACGTPVITTTCGDNLDWLDNNVGFIVEYDRMQLKGAVEKILDNNDIYLKFQENGLQLIRSRFNWDTISNDILELYKK
jgi:glycosyltransferase involved in cell wall biosynthesis